MTVSASSQELPREIRRLDEGVVNRIAAGEVVQRPANAVKELLENSLDAGATQVTITVKEGGVKSLQVQDNGSGIRKEDLAILCERHTTSKLRAFDDLATLGTLGFRGEALASISYVSHVTVTTMTVDDATHGWKASYKDGSMDPPTPKPCAATKGTTILAEDLFYNMPLRRKAIKSPSEEYSNILDVVGRYAVYRAGASVTVKRGGEARADLHTQQGSTRAEAIKAVYGVTIAKNLLPLSMEVAGGWGKEGDDEAAATASTDLRCSVEGFVTGADYAGRKTQLVLFINGRSVDSGPLKRCLEATYAALLPKAAKPFAFLDVTLPRRQVDVNVHPTKKEVSFLHQEELVDAIRNAVEEVLLASNAQRTFKQALLPGAAAPLPPPELDVVQPTYYRPDKLVRTDARVQTLHAFLGSQAAVPATQAAESDRGEEEEEEEEGEDFQVGAVGAAAAAAAAAMPAPRRRRGKEQAHLAIGDDAFLPTAMEIANAVGRDSEGQQPPSLMKSGATQGASQQPPTATQTLQRPVRHQLNPTQAAGLESIERLLANAERAPHAGLVDIMRSPTFVGMADSSRALLQVGTRLYLADLTLLTRDMFYQQVLRRFGQAPRIAVDPPLPVTDLALVALEAEEASGNWKDTQEGGSKEEVASLLSELLIRKAALLGDCFSVGIDEQGRLTSLPQLIEQYHPSQECLPAFILALGQNVDWQDESGCFGAVAAALADLYKLHILAEVEEDSTATGEEESEKERAARVREWEAAHVLLPALRLFLKPSRARAADGSVVELTRLEQLYRVFERC